MNLKSAGPLFTALHCCLLMAEDIMILRCKFLTDQLIEWPPIRGTTVLNFVRFPVWTDRWVEPAGFAEWRTVGAERNHRDEGCEVPATHRPANTGTALLLIFLTDIYISPFVGPLIPCWKSALIHPKQSSNQHVSRLIYWGSAKVVLNLLLKYVYNAWCIAVIFECH